MELAKIFAARRSHQRLGRRWFGLFRLRDMPLRRTEQPDKNAIGDKLKEAIVNLEPTTDSILVDWQIQHDSSVMADQLEFFPIVRAGFFFFDIRSKCVATFAFDIEANAALFVSLQVCSESAWSAESDRTSCRGLAFPEHSKTGSAIDELRDDVQVELFCSPQLRQVVERADVEVLGVVMQKHVGLAVAIHTPFAVALDTARAARGENGRKPAFAERLRYFHLQFSGAVRVKSAEPGLASLDEWVEILSVGRATVARDSIPVQHVAEADGARNCFPQTATTRFQTGQRSAC